MNKGKLAVVALVAALIVAFLWLDLGRFLSLEYLKSRQADIDAFYRDHPLTVLATYFVAYVAITGLALPGAAIMTLAGGAVFGVLWGTVVVSFASTLGATVAFLVSRFVLRDGIQRRYGDRLKTVNDGVERDGGFYLFTLRLVPAFPFFMVNLVMGLTPMRTLTFAWVSQLGMLPGTVVFVNAGTQLGPHRVVAGDPLARPHRLVGAARDLSASSPGGSSAPSRRDAMPGAAARRIPAPRLRAPADDSL